MVKGLLISFEGGEGAGKTTLIERVHQELSVRGLQVVKTREPGGSELAEKIRALLLQNHQEAISADAEVLLFLAARAQHLHVLIRPALEAGKIVLCDRFNDSTVAYQGIARGLGKERVAQMCTWVSGNVTPALTLYLDIDPTLGLARAKQASGTVDRMEAEKLSFHQKVRDAFQQLAQENPARIKALSAQESPDIIFQHAMQHINPVLHTL
jgi:dTMP kinase